MFIVKQAEFCSWATSHLQHTHNTTEHNTTHNTAHAQSFCSLSLLWPNYWQLTFLTVWSWGTDENDSVMSTIFVYFIYFHLFMSKINIITIKSCTETATSCVYPWFKNKADSNQGQMINAPLHIQFLLRILLY